MCYEPIKNMKYVGPKAAIKLSIGKKQTTLIDHNILSVKQNINKSSYNHVVMGFEADKVLKCLPFVDNNLGYNIVMNYKMINHGKIIADIIKKYNPAKHSGILISTDIGLVVTKNLKNNIDFSQNTVFCYQEDHSDTDLSCFIENDKIEHISFGISNVFWSGLCYLNNDTIRLLNFINKIKYTDPMFLWEIVNYLQEKNVTFKPLVLKKTQYKYMSNQNLKSIKEHK